MSAVVPFAPVHLESLPLFALPHPHQGGHDILTHHEDDPLALPADGNEFVSVIIRLCACPSFIDCQKFPSHHTYIIINDWNPFFSGL
jgi:hypothetical protein